MHGLTIHLHLNPHAPTPFQRLDTQSYVTVGNVGILFRDDLGTPYEYAALLRRWADDIEQDADLRTLAETAPVTAAI